jgi:hypothetical protein
MAYAIARIAKLKGASVGAADRHVERLRKTPNADRTRQGENFHLFGDGMPLRELVDRRINAHGGRPRRDSVECVEVLLEASPEYFMEGRDEVNPERVPPFVEKAVEFLRERYGENCVKAVLHMDETTPGETRNTKVTRGYAHGVPARLRDAVDSLEEGKRAILEGAPTSRQVAKLA